MSVESWNPNQPEPKDLSINQTVEMLKRFTKLSKEDKLDSLSEHMSEQEKQQSKLMSLEKDQWLTLLEDFENDELVDLIRFLTIAEMQISGWRIGEKSPVITINKLLRERGQKLDKELLKWIRENSDNRFIPNGPILL